MPVNFSANEAIYAENSSKLEILILSSMTTPSFKTLVRSTNKFKSYSPVSSSKTPINDTLRTLPFPLGSEESLMNKATFRFIISVISKMALIL